MAEAPPPPADRLDRLTPENQALVDAEPGVDVFINIYGDQRFNGSGAALNRLISAARSAFADREEIQRRVEQAMWSPASGPVTWTPELIARAKAQASALTDSLLALLDGKGGGA